MSQLIRLRGTQTAQTAHCSALYLTPPWFHLIGNLSLKYIGIFWRIAVKCSKLVVLMPVKFVLWLISAVLLVLHGKMDTNANEDSFGDYGCCKIAVHCNLWEEGSHFVELPDLNPARGKVNFLNLYYVNILGHTKDRQDNVLLCWPSILIFTVWAQVWGWPIAR